MRVLSRRTRAVLTSFFISLSIALVVIIFTQEIFFPFPPLKRMEQALTDLRFRQRGPTLHNTDSSRIVIVGISQESFRSLPDRWPWPKSYYTRLIRNLRRAGATAVGIDILFSSGDPSDALQRELRDTLAASAASTVLAGQIEPDAGRFRLFRAEEDYGNVLTGATRHLGLVNVLTDDDGVLRRYMPFIYDSARGIRIPTFSMAMLNAALGFEPGSTALDGNGHFLFGDKKIPAWDGSSFMINWQGPSGSFRTINIADVLDDADFRTTEERADPGLEINTFDDPDAGYLYDGTFAGKIVLVGTVNPEDKDLFTVPVGEGRMEGDNMMYGVEIHANVIQSFLDGNFTARQPGWISALIVIGLSMFTFTLTAGIKAIRTRFGLLLEILTAAMLFGQLLIVYWIAMRLFTEQNIMADLTGPLLAVFGSYVGSTVYNYVSERRQRMQIKNMFTQYVSPLVVDELLEHPEKLRLGGERKEVTIFFSDIEGFTMISEKNSPEYTVMLLNEYLSVMTSIIFANNGTLDKYEGDAIMAFWGAPLPQSDHAALACRTALQMQESLDGLMTLWVKEGKPLLKIRIGISTGEAVVGNLGGAARFDYTAIGDIVNLGARLEGANKEYRTRTIISEKTRLAAGSSVIARELDLLLVSGKSEPIRVFELLGLNRPETRSTKMTTFLERYDRGLKLYRERQWDDAVVEFEAAVRIRPDDFPSEMYIRRSKIYRESPPPADWGGVFVMERK